MPEITIDRPTTSGSDVAVHENWPAVPVICTPDKVNILPVYVKPVGVPAVVTTAEPPKLVDKVNVVLPFVAII